MQKNRWGAVLAISALGCLTPALAAPNAGVCDGLLASSTPSLYGLCVGFCEGQTCVPDFSQPDPFAECTPSSARLLELYNERKQPSDPDMPCVSGGGCPCFDAEDLNGIPTPYDQCAIDLDFGGGQLTTNIIYDVETNGTGAQAQVGEESSSCVFADAFAEPDIFIFIETTQAAAEACRQLIVDHIDANTNLCEAIFDERP